uniref:Uncharacterized protein n=1 Tax=Babesia bovis TaxID=5865 RepID=S6BG75_BABBO|nr:hypothetical protein [Babesia bovis]
MALKTGSILVSKGPPSKVFGDDNETAEPPVIKSPEIAPEQWKPKAVLSMDSITVGIGPPKALSSKPTAKSQISPKNIVVGRSVKAGLNLAPKAVPKAPTPIQVDKTEKGIPVETPKRHKDEFTEIMRDLVSTDSPKCDILEEDGKPVTEDSAETKPSQSSIVEIPPKDSLPNGQVKCFTTAMPTYGTLQEQNTISAKPLTEKAKSAHDIKLDAFRRVANKFKMITRLRCGKEEEYFPLDQYGYAMRHSHSNITDPSQCESARRTTSLTSDKFASSTFSATGGLVPASQYDIGRRAGLKMNAITQKYKAIRESIENLDSYNGTEAKDGHYMEHKPTMAKLWSKHGSTAVLTKSGTQYDEENLPALYSVYKRYSRGTAHGLL